MNILILNWRDPENPLAGGAEQSLYEHAKYWAKNGANITWFASSFKNAKKEDNLGNIKILRAGSHYTVHLSFLIYWLSGKTNKNFDIVVDCFHFLPFFTPLYIRNIKKIALINEVADRLWFSNIPFPFSWIGYMVEPLFFKFYRKVPFITASESAKNDLIKMGIKEKNINVISHGVTLPLILPKKRESYNPTVIYCSRVTKDKGIEDALKVFNILKKEVSNLEFWIVGKEEKLGYFEDLLKKNKVSTEQIKYFGFVREKKKFELLSKAWILIHPSRKEGWGLNVIEANSVGTPAVGYNVEGLRDSIIDKKTGLLSETNPNDLAKSIEVLVNNKNIREEFSNNALRWSKEFSWEKSARTSWEFINNL